MRGVGQIAATQTPKAHQPPLDRTIAALAGRQHGVVSLEQLMSLGLSARAIRDRVAAGRLHRVHRGVYAVGHSVLSRKGKWMAAVLACGPGAVVSHRSAGALLDLRPDPRPVTDVSTMRGRGRLNGIHRHRGSSLLERDVTVVEGIACSSVARTLLDLAEVIDRQGLKRACAQAEVLRTFDLAEIEDALERASGRPGAPMLAALIAEQEELPHEGLEERFLALCHEAGLPAPRVNAWIPLPDGGGVEADFYWPDRRLIAETDSRIFHFTQTAFESDRRKDQRLLIAGLQTLRFTGRQVAARPDEVVETLRRILLPW